MTDSNQTSSTNSSQQQNRSKSKEMAVVAEQMRPPIGRTPLAAEPGQAGATDSQAVLQALLHGPQGALGSGSREDQIARLSDLRLHTVQRQALATHIGRTQGNRHLQRVVTAIKGDEQTATGLGPDPGENGQETSPGQTIQRQGAAPAAPPTIVATPLTMNVGIHQKFPVRYQLQGFDQLDQINATILTYSAPISVIEDMRTPSQPNETDQLVLEANNTEGEGTLTLGLAYQGTTIESPPVTIHVTPGPALPSSPDRIFFDTDSDAIRPDAAAGLAQVAAHLQAEPHLIVKLEGHADTRHTDEHNVKLSYRRALSTRNHLISVHGIDPARLPEEHVTGRGEAAPIVTPEVNPADLQMNRRVEIILAEGPEGRELAPTVRLSPNSVVAEVGQTFAVAYEVRNVHESSRFGGTALTTTAGLHRVEGSLPSLPGGESGVLTMQAGPGPGPAEMTLSIHYGGAEYSSNVVTVDVMQAPTADYIVPFDRNPLSAPGEQVIFNARLGHAQPADFQLVYTGAGGTFETKTGPANKTIAGLQSGNLFFFIDPAWDGVTPVTVQLQVQRQADHTIFHTFNWTFGPKPYLPTTMTQQEAEGERALPSTYSYKIGPDRGGDNVDDYLHQTILETFGQRSCNITLAELKPEFLTAHPEITTQEQITAHFFGTSSNNGTFTVSAGDMIFDQHGGGMPDLAVFQAALIAMKEIHVDLPQTYEAQPGVALGRYTVRRILKPDGTKRLMKMRR